MATKCIAEGICTTTFLTGAAAAVIGTVCCLMGGSSEGLAIPVIGFAASAALLGISTVRMRLRKSAVRHY